MIVARLPYHPPETAFAAFADMPDFAFLDSAAQADPRAQVSYLCLSPVATLHLASAPFTTLRDWMSAHTPQTGPAQRADWPFPFKGGAVGWIGYDLALKEASIESRFAPLQGLPGGWFGLYTTILGFDLQHQELYYLGPADALPAIEARLRSRSGFAAVPPLSWAAEMELDVYHERHERLRAYIAAGDVYQANLTLRFSAPRPAGFSLPALHAALRQRSPAPFAACLQAGAVGLACASPERFLRLTADGAVETRPIKGTSARHLDPESDAQAARALAKNPKERAENLMITDLLRNDLGQVCEVGSVYVPQLWAVESYAQAHHLVSVVAGRLRSGLDAFDLLAATLPGGSITGAPKHRAMQIIDELELGPRGAYCGALAWVGFDGAMDSAIIIRTITATKDQLYAQAGGGITWDSVAQAEYDEAMLKISPLLAAYE